METTENLGFSTREAVREGVKIRAAAPRKHTVSCCLLLALGRGTKLGKEGHQRRLGGPLLISFHFLLSLC